MGGGTGDAANKMLGVQCGILEAGSSQGKTEQERSLRDSREGVAILNRVVSKGLTDKEALKKILRR